MMSRSIAEELAKKQKEISVSEFFERNKHILGFDTLTRSLLTTVKEGVDNSLDACEEANILPEIFIEIKQVSRNEYRILMEDNGPGIVKKQIPHIFGRLLYGSRFHSIRQSRGQQGIGISAAVMYGQLTTGKPTTVRSKTAKDDVAHEITLMMDTKRNRPDVLKQDFVIWEGKGHGTKVEIHLKGKYVKGKQSVYEYLKGTAIVNPHAQITLIEPDGTKTELNRVTEKMPPPTKEIKPHPEGIELGILIKMAKATKAKRMSSFLTGDFSRISSRVAKEICEKAMIEPTAKPTRLKLDGAKRVIEAIKQVKIMAPPTDCLSPIGELLIKKGLKNVLDDMRPDFYAPPVTRDPGVYSGNPFQVEVGIVHGGDLPSDGPVKILRFANRVPLLYQQGGCACTQAVETVDWRRYGLEQRGGKGIPYGPAIILVHVASTKIPFTSEAKEAVADIPEIREEIERALRACARRLQIHIKKKVRKKKTKEKFDIVQTLLPKIAEKSANIVGKSVPRLEPIITKIMNVVWIDDACEFKNKKHHITISIYNYTPTRKKFNLYAVVPSGSIGEKSFSLKPNRIRKSGKIRWELKSIPSTEKLEITFDLKGLDEDDFDETEIYVSGINPVQVIGAEPLPGDWDLDDEIEEPTTLDDFIKEDLNEGGEGAIEEEGEVETLSESDEAVEEVMEND
ncbi:MAG: DNA topoisomerase VI subunit B [Methanomassiliicoccales archaeon]|nr:MAG: DNA topoisomerase VI subunit B [Methanomassiliicoccales archaeon]